MTTMTPEQVRDAIVRHFAYSGPPPAREWWPQGGCSCASCLESMGCEVPDLVLDVTGLDALTSPHYIALERRKPVLPTAPVDVEANMPELVGDEGKLWAFGQNVNPRSDA